jgi:hypothetical protein
MSKKSDAFEQRIHRIHELIDGSDAEVTWNNRIPDPDNPKRSRQIDITVKRGSDADARRVPHSQPAAGC